jgi:competence protein ComEA
MEEKKMKRMKNIAVLIAALTLIFNLVGTVCAEESGKININTANEEQLTALPGVGEAYAVKIVEFRKAHGPFKSPEDLMQVTGIGAKTYERNKDRITVE